MTLIRKGRQNTAGLFTSTTGLPWLMFPSVREELTVLTQLPLDYRQFA